LEANVEVRKGHFMSRIKSFAPSIPIALSVWVRHFMLITDYGFYEDDYSRFPYLLSLPTEKIFGLISQYLSIRAGHGRPLELIFSNSFGYIGSLLGGVSGMYFVGYLLIIINVFLFYFLLKTVWNSSFAIIGALVFSLYPADVTQPFLTHSLGLQPSLTLLLIALILFTTNHKFLSYVFATCILLTYETPFLLMLSAPLLVNHWDGKLVRALKKNALIVTGIVIATFAVRSHLGEGRVTDLVFMEAITTSLTHMIQGPFVSMGTFLLRPAQTISNIDTTIMFTILVGFLLILIVLRHIKFDLPLTSHTENETTSGDTQETFESSKSLRFIVSHLRVNEVTPGIIAGLTMLILAYPITFTVRAYAISGRETRVHFAAILGASILVASLIQGLLRQAMKSGHIHLVKLGVTGWLALLLGFGVVVQKDYARSWDYQREFWIQLVELIPDLEKGNVILVEGTGLEDTRYIGANTWNLPRILEQIYEFPNEWDGYDIPRVYRLTPNWDDYILGEEGFLHLNARTTVAPRSYDRAVDPSGVIFLKTLDNQLIREKEDLMIMGSQVELKTFDLVLTPAFPPGRSYDLLIGPRQES